MKNLKIKNLNITFSEYLTEENVKEAIDRCFSDIDPDAACVNLVKINVGNTSVEQVHNVVKSIRDAFNRQGVENCIFVPLHMYGIQDIEVIEVPNEAV